MENMSMARGCGGSRGSAAALAARGARAAGTRQSRRRREKDAATPCARPAGGATSARSFAGHTARSAGAMAPTRSRLGRPKGAHAGASRAVRERDDARRAADPIRAGRGRRHRSRRVGGKIRRQRDDSKRRGHRTQRHRPLPYGVSRDGDGGDACARSPRSIWRRRRRSARVPRRCATSGEGEKATRTRLAESNQKCSFSLSLSLCLCVYLSRSPFSSPSISFSLENVFRGQVSFVYVYIATD